MALLMLQKPVSGGRVSSPYGMRKHPVTGVNKMHAGIDYALGVGTPIVAAASGRVTFAGALGDNGNLIRLDHGDGIETAYAHLSKLLVSSGAQVEKGQQIALSGATGRVTGPHLHFAVKVAGAFTDPAEALLGGFTVKDPSTPGGGEPKLNSLTVKSELMKTALLGALMIGFLLVAGE